jgi:hypothetical protein
VGEEARSDGNNVHDEEEERVKYDTVAAVGG